MRGGACELDPGLSPKSVAEVANRRIEPGYEGADRHRLGPFRFRLAWRIERELS